MGALDRIIPAIRQPVGAARLDRRNRYVPGTIVYPLAANNTTLGAVAPTKPIPSGGTSQKSNAFGTYFSTSSERLDFIQLGANPTMQAEVFTALMVIKVDALPSNVTTIFQSGAKTDQSYQASNGSFQFRVDAAGSLQVIKDNVVAVYTGGPQSIFPGKFATVSVSFTAGNPGRLRIVVDGKVVGEHTPSVSGFKAGDFSLSTKDGTYNEKGPLDIALFAYWPRAQSLIEQVDLTTNPWQLFEGPTRRVASAPATATDTSLTGAAAAIASAFGDLSTSIRMAGTGVATAAATGSLTTSIRLAGTAQAQASASGALSTAVQLAAAAGAVATADGALSTAIRLAGKAQAQASATGELAGAGAALGGAARAEASGTGALTTSIRLAGTAQAQASASGALAASPVGLGGAVRADASAIGELSTSIRLAGIAAAQASGAGVLSTGIRLSGAVAAVSSAVATLSTQIMLGGRAEAAATASGAVSIAQPNNPIDISKIHPSRISVFNGSGSRVAIFEGSGSRIAVFDGSGNRTAVFAGSGSREARFT